MRALAHPGTGRTRIPCTPCRPAQVGRRRYPEPSLRSAGSSPAAKGSSSISSRVLHQAVASRLCSHSPHVRSQASHQAPTPPGRAGSPDPTAGAGSCLPGPAVAAGTNTGSACVAAACGCRNTGACRSPAPLRSRGLSQLLPSSSPPSSCSPLPPPLPRQDPALPSTSVSRSPPTLCQAWGCFPARGRGGPGQPARSRLRHPRPVRDAWARLRVLGLGPWQERRGDRLCAALTAVHAPRWPGGSG